MKSRIAVEIVNQSKKPVPRKFLADWLSLLPPLLPRRDQKRLDRKVLCLVFLDRPAAKELNKKFRGKNYATDVLSFDGMEPESLGELIFCPEVLEEQAKENGLSYRLELSYMITHGILHLLGYEHEAGQKEADKMFRLQDEIFERLCHKL